MFLGLLKASESLLRIREAALGLPVPWKVADQGEGWLKSGKVGGILVQTLGSTGARIAIARE